MLMSCAEEPIEDSALVIQQMVKESITGSAESVLDVFGRLLPKASELLQSYITPITSFMSSDKPVSIKNKNYIEVLKKVRLLPFAAFQDILVQVPEGFTGNLTEYCDSLLTATGFTIQKANEVVAAYGEELGIFLNNVDFRKSTKSYDAFYGKVKSDRLRAEKLLQPYFKKNDSHSRAKLGDVMSRFADLDTLFIKTESLEKVHQEKDLKELTSHVQHAVNMLALIQKGLDSNEKITLSGPMARHISEGAYEIAKFVETVSLMCYNVEVAITCMNALADQLKTITK